MKSIKQQYIDLKEGKMSQANFMRNLRMSMPQVTNVTSFGDAVKILKNKGIINESLVAEEEEVFSQGAQDENYDKVGTDGYDNVSEEEKDEYPTPHVNSEEPNEDAEFDAMLKQIEDEMHGEEAVKAQYDETLNEAKEKTNPNKVHPQEYTMGIRYELKCFKGDVVKAERAVLKNLAKDPFYYTALKLSGKDAYQEAPAIKEEAPKKKAKKQTVELVDTVNAMQKVKMPKKEEKKKLKENVDAPHSIKADQEIDKSELNFLKKAYADRSTDKIPEKFKKIMQDLEDKIAAREKNEAMRFQDLPADSKKYKIVRDSKNYIIKATNADGVEFQKGDTAKTYDGEEIKIVKFEESQGKVKAIYNKGMFFAGIDIDGLEAPKPTMRPGVNIGSSFEKMKAKLAEMVKKAMAEMYDGRDNLTNISDDTKD
jgi:hypothetical protein